MIQAAARPPRCCSSPSNRKDRSAAPGSVPAPLPAASECATAPEESMMHCGVSIINSILRTPDARPCRASGYSSRSTSSLTCSGTVILGSVTTKLAGKAAGFLRTAQSGTGPAFAPSSRAQRFGERLDANSDKRRKARLSCAARQELRGRYGVPIFFCVGPIPVAVFEIDPKIFHRLAFQLGDGAFENGIGQFARRQSQAFGERRRVRRVVADQLKRERA